MIPLLLVHSDVRLHSLFNIRGANAKIARRSSAKFEWRAAKPRGASSARSLAIFALALRILKQKEGLFAVYFNVVVSFGQLNYLFCFVLFCVITGVWCFGKQRVALETWVITECFHSYFKRCQIILKLCGNLEWKQFFFQYTMKRCLWNYSSHMPAVDPYRSVWNKCLFLIWSTLWKLWNKLFSGPYFFFCDKVCTG